METCTFLLAFLVPSAIIATAAESIKNANEEHGFGEKAPSSVSKLLDIMQVMQTMINAMQKRIDMIDATNQQQSVIIEMQQRKLVNQELKMVRMKQEINRMRVHTKKAEKRITLQEMKIEELDKSLKQVALHRTNDGETTNEMIPTQEGHGNNSSFVLKADIVRSNTNRRLVMDGQSEHPAFSAYLTQELSNLGPEQAIQFHGVVLNEGNAYNPSTGIFTTPIAGIYLFSFAVEDYRIHRLWCKLVVDGKLQSSVLTRVVQQGVNSQATNVVILRLTVGQTVWIAVDSREGGDSIQGDATTRTSTFSGALLYV